MRAADLIVAAQPVNLLDPSDRAFLRSHKALIRDILATEVEA
jgi:hypothetical protein